MVDIKKNDTDLSDKADYHKSIFNLFNHLQSSQQIDTDLLDEADYHKSIFNLFNHQQSSQRKRNKNQQNSSKIYNKKRNRKLQLLDDDTDDIDISDKDYRKSIFDLFNHLQSSE